MRIVPLIILISLVGAEVPVGAGPLGLGLPRIPNLGGTLNNVTVPTTGNLASNINVVRDAVGRPRAPQLFEKDASGFRVVRGEVLVLSPDDRSLAAARSLNFRVLRQQSYDALGLSVTVLAVPDGMSASNGLEALRKADPAGQYDLNHIYDPSGSSSDAYADASIPAITPVQSIRVGMIDGGVDRRHDAFDHATIVSQDCGTRGAAVATAHGTAVASLLVGADDRDTGTLRGATLYAADVYCGEPTGGSAEAIARALAWLAENNVPVVNVSLSGPSNAILAAAVDAFLKRGHVIVAAVGNDGPAAPTEYPAGFPGVVGVTSVDDRLAVQMEANRGADVAFAARGVDVDVASLRGSHDTVSGTSFAAPIVTARFALLVPRPDSRAAQQAWITLEHSALHLGPPGRNSTYGYGYLDRPNARENATAAK